VVCSHAWGLQVRRALHPSTHRDQRLASNPSLYSAYDAHARSTLSRGRVATPQRRPQSPPQPASIKRTQRRLRLVLLRCLLQLAVHQLPQNVQLLLVQAL